MARPIKGSEGKGNVNWTKEQLILAAADQFALHGFEGASLSKIREKVGVKNSTIMYHFKSKQGLYLAVTKHLEQSLSQFVQKIIDQHYHLPVMKRFNVFCFELQKWCGVEQTFASIIVQETMNKQLHSADSFIYQNIGKHFEQAIVFLQGSPIDPLWSELNWQIFIVNLIFSILVGQAISIAVPITLGIDEQSYKTQQLNEVVRMNLMANINDQQAVLNFLNN